MICYYNVNMKRFSEYNLYLEATLPSQNAANQSWAWRLQFVFVTFFNFILNFKNLMILWILPSRSHDLPYKSHMTHDYCAMALIFGYLCQWFHKVGFPELKITIQSCGAHSRNYLDLTLNLAKVKVKCQTRGHRSITPKILRQCKELTPIFRGNLGVA